MSEKILKALIQLFAILSKESVSALEKDDEYVHAFLKQRIDEDAVAEYYQLYQSLRTKKNTSGKSGYHTSVTDSVAVIGISRQINQTLNQKQKTITLAQLFEFVYHSNDSIPGKLAILDTLSDIFKIDKAEKESILAYTQGLHHQSNQIKLLDSNLTLCINNNDPALAVLRVPQSDIFLLKAINDSTIKCNGRLLKTDHIQFITDGTVLQTVQGNTLFFSEITDLFFDKKIEPFSYNVIDVEYTFSTKTVGLRPINISEGPRKVVGILGASGSGKTTLLSILSGINKPSSGKVLLNEQNIHEDKNIISSGIIGYVPQDDSLIEELTVFENLYFSAKLSIGKENDEFIRKKVNQVLAQMGLLEIAHLIVGNHSNKVISGGQRKRLNIAVELIRDPLVIFMDEPTSGLSSKDSENLMNHIHSLAKTGKLIFIVIHQPSPAVYKLFDKIIILDKGGYQIFYGNTPKSISYFKNMDGWANSSVGDCYYCGSIQPELIFDIVETEKVNEYGNYTGERKIPPEKWYKAFQEHFKINFQFERGGIAIENKKPGWFRQFYSYLTRETASKLRNKQFILLNLIEAPVLAFILSFIIRYSNSEINGHYIFKENDNIPAYIFMCIIVFIFLGTTLTAEEIYKDQKLLSREQLLGLNKHAYLLSKICIAGFISLFQTTAFVFIGNSIAGVDGMFGYYWGILFLISILSNITGLILSSTFNSVVSIYIMIPILLIPQLILGGAIFNYEKINRAVGGGYHIPLVAEVIPARWAYEALMVAQFRYNSYQIPLYDIEKQISEYKYQSSHYLPYLINIMDDAIVATNTNDSKLADSSYQLLAFHNYKYKMIDHRFEYSLLKTEPANDRKLRLLHQTRKQIDSLINLNNLWLTEAISIREQILIKLNGNEKLNHLKRNYYNDYLADIVKNSFATENIVFEKGSLIRTFEPIYNNGAMGNFQRNHFFAPEKKIPFVQKYINTYIYNAMVIVIFILFSYLILSFDLIKKFLYLLKFNH